MAHQGIINIDINMVLIIQMLRNDFYRSPLARVNWNEPGQIMKILDAGCYGVLPQQIRS